MRDNVKSRITGWELNPDHPSPSYHPHDAEVTRCAFKGCILSCQRCGHNRKVSPSLLNRFLHGAYCRECGHYGWPSICPVMDLTDWTWQSVAECAEEELLESLPAKKTVRRANGYKSIAA